MKRLWTCTALVLVAAIGCAKSKVDGQLNAGGSTFVAPLMAEWTAAYKKERNIELHYNAVGSGKGIEQTIDKTFDFGCTDAPLTDAETKRAQQAGGDIIYIPVAMGGVVVTYHLEGFTGVTTPVRFTGPLLADIFLGKITNWNDSRLQEVQEAGVKLPNQKIVVVHRSDGSGTTFIFADFLSKVSPEWKEKLGAATSLPWPTGSGHNGNQGVADHIKKTPGAIGYVGLEFAFDDDVSFGAVRNQAGKFVQPNAHSIQSAANAVLTTMPADLRFSLTDAAGSDSYPISGTTWAIVYAKPPRNGAQVVEFLRWATHDGQKLAAGKHFVPLPENLVGRIDQKLNELATR